MNLEILQDWNLWTSGPFQDHGIGTLGLLDLLGQEGLEPVDFRPISRPWDWNLWTSGPFQDHGLGMLGLLDQLYFINRDNCFFCFLIPYFINRGVY